LTRVTNAAAIDAERLDLLLVDVPANAPLGSGLAPSTEAIDCLYFLDIKLFLLGFSIVGFVGDSSSSHCTLLEIFFHSLLQSAELPEKLVIVLAMSGDFDIGHCKDVRTHCPAIGVR